MHDFWGNYGWAGKKDALVFESALDALLYKRDARLPSAEVELFHLQPQQPRKTPELIELTLYISSASQICERAETVLRHFIANFLAGPDHFHSLETVDLATAPKRAMQDEICAAPTLVIRKGRYTRRLIGIFNEVDLFRACLLPQAARAPSANSPGAAKVRGS
jgi:hypothetical protein